MVRQINRARKVRELSYEGRPTAKPDRVSFLSVSVVNMGCVTFLEQQDARET
jgi:hypothetical protein